MFKFKLKIFIKLLNRKLNALNNTQKYFINRLLFVEVVMLSYFNKNRQKTNISAIKNN